MNDAAPMPDNPTNIPHQGAGRRISEEEWLEAVQDEREGAYYDAQRNPASDYGRAWRDSTDSRADSPAAPENDSNPDELQRGLTVGRGGVGLTVEVEPNTPLLRPFDKALLDSMTPEQWEKLKETMQLLSRMSRYTGLHKAADGKHARGQLEARMEVDKMVGRTTDLFRAVEQQAKEAYARVIGKYDVLKAGADPKEVARQVDRAFDALKQQYADPQHNRKRHNLISQLNTRIARHAAEQSLDPTLLRKPRGRKREPRPMTNEVLTVDTDRVQAVDKWLSAVKLPVVDELTRAYNMQPTPNGVIAYAKGRRFINRITAYSESLRAKSAVPYTPELNFEATESPVNDSPKVEGPDSEDPELRQVFHIAESAEHYNGFMYALAYARGKALEIALKMLERRGEIDPAIGRYAAGAIEEFGYCMRVSANIPAERFEPIAEQLERFGAEAIYKNPGLLLTPNGKLLMQATLHEQQRRIARAKPRYEAVVSVFGKQLPSEVLNIDDLPALTISQLLVNKARSGNKAA